MFGGTTTHVPALQNPSFFYPQAQMVDKILKIKLALSIVAYRMLNIWEFGEFLK